MVDGSKSPTIHLAIVCTFLFYLLQQPNFASKCWFRPNLRQGEPYPFIALKYFELLKRRETSIDKLHVGLQYCIYFLSTLFFGFFNHIFVYFGREYHWILQKTQQFTVPSALVLHIWILTVWIRFFCRFADCIWSSL